jgi:hypothetical protein
MQMGCQLSELRFTARTIVIVINEVVISHITNLKRERLFPPAS